MPIQVIGNVKERSSFDIVVKILGELVLTASEVLDWRNNRRTSLHTAPSRNPRKLQSFQDCSDPVH